VGCKLAVIALVHRDSGAELKTLMFGPDTNFATLLNCKGGNYQNKDVSDVPISVDPQAVA